MTELRKCATCAFWRAGLTPLTNLPDQPDVGLGKDAKDTGVCELYPPQVFVTGTFDSISSIQPVTHASRRCGEWKNADWFVEPDDTTPPQPDSPPDHEGAGVRHLFPIRPVPSAA